MGIQNVFLVAGWRHRCTSHYPPWGFKTPSPARNVVECSTAMLTIPHGDSKPEYLLSARRYAHVLTIPHGDSKHRPGSRYYPQAITHYPPWGFKTSIQLVSIRSIYPAHYPPWGFKTSIQLVSIRSIYPAHYPPWGFKTTCLYLIPNDAVCSLSPMGIQNYAGTWPARPTVRLTIPHGDSKPPFLHLKNLPAPPEESTCPPNIYSYDPLFKHWSVSPGKPAPGTGEVVGPGLKRIRFSGCSSK